MPDKGTAEIVREALAQARKVQERWDAHCRDESARGGFYVVNDGHDAVCRFKCRECGEDHRVTPDPVEGCFTFSCHCSREQGKGKG